MVISSANGLFWQLFDGQNGENDNVITLSARIMMYQ